MGESKVVGFESGAGLLASGVAPMEGFSHCTVPAFRREQLFAFLLVQ
jgi:hypothetical protein